EKSCALRRAPPAFAGDDAIEIADLLDQNRLNDAVVPNGLRKFIELGVVHLDTRLFFVRREEIDVDFNSALTRRLGRVWNQRAQSFSECGPSLEHMSLSHCCCGSITPTRPVTPRAAKAFPWPARCRPQLPATSRRTTRPGCR